MSSILFKNITIHYKKEGSGKTNVVLLHGFLEGLDIWKDYSKELSKSYTVISIDLLGHGKSQSLAYVHTLEEMAEAVNEVLKALDLRKAIFVGHSLGGYVALAFAELYIHKVKGLCLFNSSASADSEQKKKDRLRAIEVVKQNHELFIKMAIPNLFSAPEGNKKAIEKTLKIALKTPKQGIIAAINGMMQRPNREIIIKFSQYPVFFVIGKNDAVVPFEVAIQQCELAKEHSYYLSEKGSHMCFFEDEEALVRLKEFIQNV
ncbi:MAG: alpha/beta hydrolase [Bacteroidetes bacterium]|nr:alpha/beta hydrolase [Bacteroidota bacterium]